MSVNKEWTDSGYEAIAKLLGTRAGLSFRPSQRLSIEQGIDRAMRHEGLSDLAAYLRGLKSDPAMLDNLLIQTTVGETYFFRDGKQFEVIGDQILPEICQRSDPRRRLRLWSAACASGEEAYSLAMMLHRKGLLSRASVLGTDISRAALKLAQDATYRKWSLRGKGKQLAARYLDQVDGKYRVRPLIRQSVHFEYLNLALDNYPSSVTATRGLDLILCRNVMIYFDRETIQSIVHRFHRCLLPGGWLVTATSDPPIHEYGLFDVLSTDHGMVFRKSEASMPTTFGNTVSALVTKTPSTFAGNDQVPGQLSHQPQPRAADSDDQAARRSSDRLGEARAAMEAGNYEQAASIAADYPSLDQAASIQVKALANLDVLRAEQACAEATTMHPLSKELHYLHAILLMDLNRHGEAADALRRVLFLDRSLALAHFSLASVQRTRGNLRDARRHFRQAQQVCDAYRLDAPVPLGEGQRVRDLLEMIKLQLAAIEKETGAET